MFKNALISVSDKTGLVDFVKPLVAQGLRIVSTGGTAQTLRAAGISVADVSEQTHFPEVMGGRVKTLHPNVHMCLLAREGEAGDAKILREAGLELFDLVICNLYPFEATVMKGASDEEMIENIDIGGPSMLRAAAKNHERVTVVCDPKDYAWITQKATGQSRLELADRRRLAAKVFAHVSSYDSLVAEKLGAGWGDELPFAGHRVMELRYGENPHQAAGWYRFLGDNTGLQEAKVLQGKPLSYNNILDLDAAAGLVNEFSEPTVVAVKHNNPCGAGTAASIEEAVTLALQADPVSVFGGIVALNRAVTAEAAQSLSAIFLECILAPEFSPQALEIFAKKKNLRVLEWSKMLAAKKRVDIRSVTGGFVVQNPDALSNITADWKFFGATPSTAVLADLLLAEKVCASLKSNAIALVKGGQTLGLGMGQVNRVEAVAHAVTRLQHHHAGLSSAGAASGGDLVLASDAFFPFPDSIEIAAKAGVKWVVQPGGSLKDEEVFAVARELGVNMVVTGCRHFRH